MEIINKNIRYLREQAGWTQKELADKLGTTKSMIGAYEEFRSVPLLMVTVKIADVFNIDLDSLVRNDLGKNAPKKTVKDKYKRGRDILAITVDQHAKENVELVNQKASAGYLSNFSDTEFIKDLPKIAIPVLSKTRTYRAFEIKGDSMLPVKNGDIMVGSYVDNIEKIKDGKTYIIVSGNEGVVYKRVYKFLSEEKFLLISDNRHYDPYLIDVSDILELWAFASRITLEEEIVESPNEKSLDFMALKWMETFFKK